MKLYDDDGREVTNAATLRALAESEQIIADWERRHGFTSDDEQKMNSR